MSHRVLASKPCSVGVLRRRPPTRQPRERRGSSSPQRCSVEQGLGLQLQMNVRITFEGGILQRNGVAEDTIEQVSPKLKLRKGFLRGGEGQRATVLIRKPRTRRLVPHFANPGSARKPRDSPRRLALTVSFCELRHVEAQRRK